MNPTLSGINILTGQLSGLMDGEARYIYHHLRSGSILQTRAHPAGFIEVFFGSHCLGRLNPILSRKVAELMEVNCQFRLTIGAIVREKYLPPSAIELELEWVDQSMVEAA